MVDEQLRDFRNFLYLVWDHLNLPDPTPIQYDIAEYIQHGPKRRVVQAFRGVGKSWITSAFVVHQLLLDPTKNILVVSASKQRADDFSTFTLRLITDMPLLRHLIPTENQRNSKVAFDVGPAPASHAPSVVSKGITSQITGARADLIIADDVESMNNSQTQTMRDKLSEAIKEFDAVLKPDGAILFLGTPQTEGSIYAALPERGFKTRIWPARYPRTTQLKRYGDQLAPTIYSKVEEDEELVGQPTDPKRFDAEDLMEREASYGRTGFALQFMLDPSMNDLDRYPLKLADLVVMSLNPREGPQKPVWATSSDNVIQDLPNVGMPGDRFYGPVTLGDGSWAPYTGSVMAIDPSGRGADETSYAVVKMLNGFLFVTDAGGMPGGYSEDTLKRLAMVAKEQEVNLIRIESNFGDGMFTQLLKPVLAKIYRVTCEEVRHSVQKERRICDTLEPVMNSHKLVIDRKVIENDYDSTRHMMPEKALRYQLMYQMSRVTRHRGALAHDDRLDVLAMGVAYWAEQMAQDADDQIAHRKDEALRDELERFAQGALGRKPRPLSWF
jgi:hypothetical protein